MTSDFNDIHQAKISKLQERLGSISNNLRKSTVSDTQKEKQKDFGNFYSASMSTQSQQKQSHFESEKDPFRNEIFQQIRQKEDHKSLETTRIVENQQVKQQEESKRLEAKSNAENQQKSKDDFLSKKSEEQDPGQITNKQRVMQESKSWQPWKSIPKEKLSHLEKKTLSRLFKKR